MLKEFNNLNMKPQNLAQLMVTLQTTLENQPDETIRNLSNAFSNDWAHA